MGKCRIRGSLRRLRNTLSYGEEDNYVNINKPDFWELDLGLLVSPLRTQAGGLATTTATCSSSSSSGSMSGRSTVGAHLNPPRKFDSNNTSHSDELSRCSVESSPSETRNFKPGHTRTTSDGTHRWLLCKSPTVNVLPQGTFALSGRLTTAC